MKKILVCLSLVVAMATSGAVVAQEKKIAVINIQAAILSTDEAQKKLKDFAAKADIAAMRAKAESIIAESKKLEDDAKKNSAVWSDEQKADFNKQMEYLRADLDVEVKKLQNEERTIQQQILASMQERAVAAYREVVESEGIALVLHPNAVQYAEPSFDITQKVTDRLNKAK